MTIVLSYMLLCHSGFFFFRGCDLLELEDSVVLLGFFIVLKKKKEKAKAIQMNDFLHI